MVRCLRKILRRGKRPEPEAPPGDGSGGAAHPSGPAPEPLHRGRRRLKETYTSHWDLDYLPRDELERRLREDSKS